MTKINQPTPNKPQGDKFMLTTPICPPVKHFLPKIRQTNYILSKHKFAFFFRIFSFYPTKTSSHSLTERGKNGMVSIILPNKNNNIVADGRRLSWV